jgi:hypothetical protein
MLYSVLQHAGLTIVLACDIKRERSMCNIVTKYVHVTQRQKYLGKTNSMEQSSRESDTCLVSEEISINLWNRKVHYRIRKSQVNPGKPANPISKLHFNNIFPSTSKF